MLFIPIPTLSPTSAALAKPLSIKIAEIKLSDGRMATQNDLTSIGVLVFRMSAGPLQFWDETQKQWRASPPDQELLTAKPVMAVYKQGAALGWEATLVAIGQKDAKGADVYVAASAGAPSYFVRAVARTAQIAGGDSGLSGRSETFTFADVAANARFSAQFDTPATLPNSAHRVRMQLKGDALQTAGYIEIRAQPAFEVEIANCDAGGNVLAKVMLLGSGAIQLMPAVGSRVVIEGDAEMNRVLYTPSGGGAKRWLT